MGGLGAEERLTQIRRQAYTAVVEAVRAELADVVDLRPALRQVLADVVLTLDCQGAVVVLLDDQTQRFHLLAQVGMDQAVLGAWSSFPADAPVPARDAVRTRSIVLLTSAEERDRRYPAFRGVAAPRGTYATVPMLVDGRPVGAITLAWQRVRVLDELDTTLLMRVAEECGSALVADR